MVHKHIHNIVFVVCLIAVKGKIEIKVVCVSN